MRKLFRFVNDDRIVKGRTWWPLPQALSVAPHLNSVREEGSAVEGAVIEQLFQEVPRARQGDNKLLVQKTLNFLGAAGNTEHFFARNGISTEHARSTNGARLYSVLVRISESGKSFLRLRQSTREQALSEFGSKKVGRGSRHTFATLPTTVDPAP